MPHEQILRYFLLILSLASFLSLATAVFLFAKHKGHIDALKEAAQTYKILAEAYSEKIDYLTCKIAKMEIEIGELKMQIKVQEAGVKVAIREIVDGLKKAALLKGDGR